MKTVDYCLQNLPALKDRQESLDISFIEIPGRPLLIDMGVQAQGGWAAAKAALDFFLEGRGVVEFGDLRVENWRLATLDIFWDNLPATLRETYLGGGSQIYTGKRVDITLPIAFLSAANLPKDEGWWAKFNILDERERLYCIIVARQGSLVHNIFKAAFYLSSNIDLLLQKGVAPEDFLWGWGSCPIAPFKHQAKHLACHGAVTSFWLKGEDERLAALTEGLGGFGEIRLHNFSSGRTFISGKIDRRQIPGLLEGISSQG
ncbi:hypothetical protein MGLY_04160 [Neomoorella glycerini]|uniref:Uncharacterized protein n=1 Tax=Neomoorella glycerini TaxID=55779 RepID=A0A6I5ZMI9_9FIRM|nr:hypothetical protein [Moorella glycerini]QGP91092.1 hypothetical protein MGLY_04160 [Moorella glycerini]